MNSIFYKANISEKKYGHNLIVIDVEKLMGSQRIANF